MKHILIFFSIILLVNTLAAQQPYNPKKMVFVATNKPNTIIYNDTIYKGSNQYKSLLLRTGDKDLIKLYQQHQSNKISGSIIGTLGTLAMFIGVANASSNADNKTTGWIAAGSGLAATIVGSYLVLVGQQKIAIATELFNTRYAARTTAGVGIIGNGVGLVVKF